MSDFLSNYFVDNKHFSYNRNPIFKILNCFIIMYVMISSTTNYDLIIKFIGYNFWMFGYLDEFSLWLMLGVNNFFRGLLSIIFDDYKNFCTPSKKITYIEGDFKFILQETEFKIQSTKDFLNKDQIIDFSEIYNNIENNDLSKEDFSQICSYVKNKLIPVKGKYFCIFHMLMNNQDYIDFFNQLDMNNLKIVNKKEALAIKKQDNNIVDYILHSIDIYYCVIMFTTSNLTIFLPIIFYNQSNLDVNLVIILCILNFIIYIIYLLFFRDYKALVCGRIFNTNFKDKYM